MIIVNEFSFNLLCGARSFQNHLKSTNVPDHRSDGDRRMTKSNGFSLIELAVVMFIATIILTAGMKLLAARAETASNIVTNERQLTIRDALTSYLGKKGRLPCPDTKTGLATPPDGQESRTGNPSACSANYGVVPYMELGLSKDTARDGWDNYFSYAVSPRWTLTFVNSAVANTPTTSVANSAFFVGIAGALTINDRNLTTGAAVPDTTTAVAVIISHGKNGLGAVTSKGTLTALASNPSDEFTNANAGTTFYKRDYTDTDVSNNAGAFDDIVLVLKPDDLIIPLKKDGSLKPEMGTIYDQISRIEAAILGTFNIAACKFGSPGNDNFNGLGITSTVDQTDPWGQPIHIYVKGDTIGIGNGGKYAYKIISFGSNGTLNAFTGGSALNDFHSNNKDAQANIGDDIYIYKTYAQVLGKLNVSSVQCP